MSEARPHTTPALAMEIVRSAHSVEHQVDNRDEGAKAAKVGVRLGECLSIVRSYASARHEGGMHPTQELRMSEPDPVGRNTWLDYRSGQEFEHQLIDRKTSWFLTSQAILFAAYGVSLREMPDIGIGHQFRDVTASAGMALTGIAVIGVLSLVVAKIIHWRQYRDFFVRHASLPEPYANRELPWGAATWTTPITLLPDMLYPFVFFMAWFSLARASG